MRLYLRSHDRRPDPPPLATNDRATVLVGIAMWAVLWVLAALDHEHLAAEGRSWWLWTPPVGIALGLVGLWYVRGRDAQSR